VEKPNSVLPLTKVKATFHGDLLMASSLLKWLRSVQVSITKGPNSLKVMIQHSMMCWQSSELSFTLFLNLGFAKQRSEDWLLRRSIVYT